MNILKFAALAILAGASSTALATFSHKGGGNHCGGGNNGGGDPTPECVVTWDFTSGSNVNGDPLTYTGTSTAGGSYSLVLQGFTVGRHKDNNGNTLGYSGQIGDGATSYTTDGTVPRYGIGVHSPGESTHWGSKIDNIKNSGQSQYLRDAVLFDFESCVVSVEEISLLKAYNGADTDFELWAYSGAELEINNLAGPGQIPDYDTWAGNGDWTLITQNYGDSSDRTVSINSPVASRYFVLIAGANKKHNNDAFRISGLTVSCDPAHCEPSEGGGDPGVPVPGTLALLGIGALATRRRWGRKAS
ncbi:PEP-CTERM sorting domain-containing protein [Thiosocius teredinicola]|uniref:PEP-CTERM sorting domain-containing protein n=1 Tax=Thiosocius teredinicola TaxID=1973002 RepID=UPI000990FAF8